MENLYKTPAAKLEIDEDNNSGMGQDVFPAGVKGWSWGAFLFNWIWAIGNQTWIGLLSLVPYVGVVMTVMLGIKGREWAWKNKRWESVDHFNRVQRLWTIWALVLTGIMILLIVAAIVIPALDTQTPNSGV